MKTSTRVLLFLASFVALALLLWTHDGPVPLRGVAHAAPYFLQRGPTNDVRPTLTNWQFEQRTNTSTWQGTSPENLLSHAGAPIDVNGQNIQNLADPTTNQQAATKAYADSVGVAAANLYMVSEMLGVQGTRPKTSATSGTTVTIEAMGTVFFRDPGGTHILCGGSPCYRYKAWPASVSLNVASSSATCPTCGALANNTRYYMYFYGTVYPAAAQLFLEVSTTAPSGGRVTKSGDDSRIFIGTFATTSTGAILPYVQSGEHYRYTSRPRVGFGNGLNLALDSGTAAVDTNVTFGALVPPLATVVRCSGHLLGVTSSTWVSIWNLGASATEQQIAAATAVNARPIGFSFLAKSAGFTYSLDAATSDLSVWVDGFDL